jgi:hypothetical protein
MLTDLSKAAEVTGKPRGEIQAVESWRLDISVLGQNVLQYLLFSHRKMQRELLTRRKKND